MSQVRPLNELVKEVGLQTRVHLIGTAVTSIASLGHASLVAVD